MRVGPLAGRAAVIGDATIWVVVPAFREAAHIGRVVATMPAFVDHVVVVDDASPDDTARAATEVGDARVRLVRHARNLGVGAAIVRGYREALDGGGAGRDAVAVMAGDGQMDPADLLDVVAPVARGDADYVKGTRFWVPSLWRTMGIGRRVVGGVLSVLTARATGLPITDSQCGYTAISGAMLARLDLDAVFTGFGYPNDLLSHLAVRGARVAEVPVRPVYGTEQSKLRPRHVPRIFALVARAAVRRARAAVVSSIWVTSPEEVRPVRATYVDRSSRDAHAEREIREERDARGAGVPPRGGAESAP